MKQSFDAIVIWLFVLLIIGRTSSRALPTNQGDQSISRTNGIDQEENIISKLMGLEECDGKDEVCQNRRMIAEAHLDYIYTQNHEP